MVYRDTALSLRPHLQDTCPEPTTPRLSQGQQAKPRSTRPSTRTFLHPAACHTEPTTRREICAAPNSEMRPNPFQITALQRGQLRQHGLSPCTVSTANVPGATALLAALPRRAWAGPIFGRGRRSSARRRARPGRAGAQLAAEAAVLGTWVQRAPVLDV